MSDDAKRCMMEGIEKCLASGQLGVSGAGASLWWAEERRDEEMVIESLVNFLMKFGQKEEKKKILSLGL